MKYLTINGSSIVECFVYCSLCQGNFSWLRGYVKKDCLTYVAVCRGCRMKFKDWRKKLNISKED